MIDLAQGGHRYQQIPSQLKEEKIARKITTENGSLDTEESDMDLSSNSDEKKLTESESTVPKRETGSRNHFLTSRTLLKKASSSSESKEVVLDNSEEEEERLSDYENECVGCDGFQTTKKKTTGVSKFCANGGCMKDEQTTNSSATPAELRSRRKRSNVLLDRLSY
ncbi:hypothetical protein ILUMI_11378 [Ignelater luminosus]|uniref:Uncharacterized protein n=1 Tax=Ignelater luminosus TaxID=2038154 RepID=A0A8K0GDA6_IGNLU|nr:hypothetical protein ILUMI_11378 [Ignelater luminosus]